MVTRSVVRETASVTGETGLRAEGVVVRYGSGRHTTTAVDDVNLAVAPGEIVGLLGASGSARLPASGWRGPLACSGCARPA